MACQAPFYDSKCYSDMLQKVFTKYWLVLNIGLTVVLTWLVLPSDLKSATFYPLLWMSLFVIELSILLPSVFRGETLVDARARVLKSIVWDAFGYITLFMVLFLAFHWLNGGLTAEYDVNAGVWRYAAPATTWLPSSVNRVDAFRNFNFFATLLIIGCCLNSAAGKRSKRFLLQCLCVSSGCFATFALLRGFFEAEPYKLYMSETLSNSWGTFFGFWLLVSIGTFAESFSSRTKYPQWIYLVGILPNLVGMLFYASPPAVVLYSVLSILLFIYLCAYISAHVQSHVIVKLVLLTVIVYVSVFVIGIFAFPESALAAKIDMLTRFSEWWEPLQATKTVRSDAALTIWGDHMWYGSGAQGFEYYLGSVLDDTAWTNVRADKAFVYNDFIQFLCEFGLLGCSALVAIMISLIVPLFSRARNAWVHDTHDSNAGRNYLLRISPFVVTGVVATLCCFMEAFISSPLRLPAIFISVFVVLAVMPAFLPKR